MHTLSLRTFKTTVYCAIVGIVVVIAIPNSTYRASTDPIVRAIGMSGLALLAIAAIANLVSLLSGVAAWAKGAGRIPWVFASALLLLVPGGIWVAYLLNL